MSDFAWPDLSALLMVTEEVMTRDGHVLQIASEADLKAGYERARQYLDYTPDASICRIAAVMFEGLAARHPLVDGNKRLSALAMLTLLDMNGLYLDTSEIELHRMLDGLVSGKVSLDELTDYLSVHSIDDDRS